MSGFSTEHESHYCVNDTSIATVHANLKFWCGNVCKWCGERLAKRGAKLTPIPPWKRIAPPARVLPPPLSLD